MKALACILLLGSTSCATYEPPAPVSAFVAGDLAQMEAFCRKQLAEGNENSFALYLNLLATTEFLQGNLEAAFRHFRRAGGFMGNWRVSGAEELGAIVGSESSKFYRGDPYERAMNGYYLGLLYWMRGEPDNARAAFKKGLLADAESEGEQYQTDFALLSWLAGRASRAMGVPADAEQFFADARGAQEFAQAHGSRGRPDARVLRQPLHGNVVFLVDVGLGPEKYAGGKDGELAMFAGRGQHEQQAEFFIGGHSLGRSEILVDLPYQAMTRGGTAMEGIRAGKAVFKDIATVAGVILVSEGTKHGNKSSSEVAQLATGVGLLLAALLTSTAADTRHWSTLPDTVQVLTADLPPGRHEVRVEFQDGGGRAIARLTQRWTVEAPEHGESIYYFRSIPGLDGGVATASQPGPRTKRNE